MAEARTVAFHTLGCKLNFSETSTLSRMLESEGFEKKEFDSMAEDRKSTRLNSSH